MARDFSVRKKKSRLLSSNQDLYQWETLANEQVKQAIEIAPILNPYIETLTGEHLGTDFFKKIVGEIEEKFLAQNKKSKLLKISLEKLSETSVVGSIGRVSFFIQVIHALINKGYIISFDFREVFLQADDQPPPAHYREADDYLLKDSEKYQELISGFGYQFGKALFNRFRPQIDAHSSKTEILVATHYASIKQQDVKVVADFDIPLVTLPCFNSSYEAHIYYDICNWDRICKTLSTPLEPRKNCLVLAFTSKDPITELLHSFECYNLTAFAAHAEIIIILQGKAYEALEERERLFSAIAESMPDLECKKFFHVLLLTKDLKSLSPGETLLSLAPAYPHENEFTPLANNAGYYLSSSAFFASIGYHLEQDEKFTSEWLEQTEISPKISEIKPEEEAISGYIYGGASSENIRPSKGLDKETLKSQVVGLTFKYNLTQELQQEQQHSQVLKQNQDLTKQQNLNHQRQHQLNEQADFPFYTPPVPISIFALSLCKFAEDDLKCLTFEDQLQQEMYFTSWYRSNYSRAAISRKILDSSEGFLADHIAKILGLAYTISPEMVSLLAVESTPISIGQTAKIVGNITKLAAATPMYHAGQHKMIPLPGSCESIEDYLIKGIFYHFCDFTDGINPAHRHVGYSRVLGKSLMQGWTNVSATLRPLSGVPLEISKLPLLANREDGGYRSHFSPNLLSFDELQSSYFNSLLKIFTPNRYELYRLPKLPTNTQSYKNSYIILERTKALYYVDDKGQVLASKLTDYDPLIAGLKEAKPIAPNKYCLSSDQLAAWITDKNGVTAANRFTNPDYIAEKEADFFALIKLTFPEHVDIVNKLFESFDNHDLDNIRILFQLFISVGQKRFALFLNYLVYLDQKCLLNHFSKIHFSYAPTVFTLVDFFKKAEAKVVYTHHSHLGGRLQHNQAIIEENDQSCFLNLAQRTPVSSSEQDWPLFERFAHAVLVFTAKNYMYINSNGLKEVEEFWHRVAAKFLIYCEGNANQQRQLLNLFLAQLISKDGLKLAPLRKLDTLLVCLENLIDHAIEKHTLWEQVEELEAISLAWTDVPYAIDYNGFHLVCKEMELKAGSMGADRNSYTVSLRELSASIHAFNPSPPLKTQVFRYLGKETFREELNFYRSLYPSQYSNPNEQKIYELIWAYYVSAFTGINYNPHPEEIDFIKRCLHFLQQHPYAKTVDVDQVLLISHFLQRLYGLKTNAQKGTMTLWALWQEHDLSFHLPTTLPVPEILAHKFDRKELKKFLLAHQTELKSSLTAILRSVRFKGSGKALHPAQAEAALAESLLANFFAEDREEYELCLQLLKILVSPFGITLFLENLLDLLILIESLRQLKTIDLQFFAELQIILKKNPDIKLAVSLLKLAKEKLENRPEHLKPFTLFLQGLAEQPELLPMDQGLELILDYCLSASLEEVSLPLLFDFYQTLKNDSETLKKLLELMRDKNVYAFFHQHIPYELSASLLKKATELIKKTNDAPSVLTLIEYALGEKEQDDDNSFLDTFLDLEQKKCSSILLLCSAICKQQNRSPSELIELLIPIPENYLQTLICLYKHYQIPISKLKEILESPSITAAINALEEELYQADLPSYRYDVKDLKQKIKEIRYSSWDDKPPQFLTQAARKRLKRDYKKVMDYIENQPIYVEIKEGVTCSYTVHQLKNRHFPVVFKALQERISRGENKTENQLALLALCCVALKRTCKKFPRSTQLLPLIHRLTEDSQLIQELKTGAGKSILAAINGALSVAEGRTALIPTENEKLGRDGIVNFQDFYRYIGVRCGEQIIEAHTPYSDYVANGINYSTPYGLSLFFISMAIQKKRLPKNRDLIWDEIDASLISTVPFRLAATLEPILLDTKNWSKVYNYLLEFVQERELFLDNACSNRDDIHNFRMYCLSKTPDKQLTAFIKRIPDSLLETLVDSARLAVQLEEKVDYMVVEKEELGNKKFYGAPYLPHTSRAEPRASFGAGAQPLLHTEKNKELSAEDSTVFSVLPDTETIISMTPKNLADKIRAEGGSTTGLTATPGMPDQLGEFHKLYGTKAAYYPSFHPDRCQDLGIIPAEGWDDQKQATLKLIRLSREQRKNQPILLICESAQAASDLYKDLNSDEHPWSTQSYYGYSQDPDEEERFIVQAGQENTISITTKCESRGADFDSEHEHGLLVINLCTRVTEEELIQIKGRGGRNGKPGQFCSIIDVQQLGLVKTAPAEEIAATFKSFQLQLGLKAQQERARTRFLEDTRCLATWYLLDLREKADRILSRQHGRDYSLVETVEFMKILRDFNRKTESHYFELLKTHGQPNEELQQRFLEYITNEYNQILERWLPDEKFSHYQPVEPLVPFQGLETFEGMNEIKIKQLLALSELLAMGWEALGHQSINTSLSKVERVAEALDEYGKDQGGIQTIIGQLVTELELVNISDLLSMLDSLETTCLDTLEELPPVTESLFSKQNALAYVKEYVANTKTQLIEKRWEELTLPSLAADIFSSEDNTSFLAGMAKKGLFNVGGKVGIYALIKLYLLPKLMKMLQDQIKIWVPDDEAKQLQLLKLLQELEPALQDFLTAIPKHIHSKEAIWSLILDKLLPLLEHPSIKEAAQLLNNDAGTAVEGIVALIKAIEPHKALSLKELVNSKTLIQLLKLASQFGLIQLLLQNPQFKEILNQFSLLDTEFFTAFDQSDFKSLFKLIHLLAHPVFFKFLKELPPNANFNQLKAWLNPEADLLPDCVSQAVETLNEYQLNRGNIEARQAQKIQGLKAKFSLSPEKLQQDLQALEPVFPIEVPPPPIPTPLSALILAWISTHWLQSLLLLTVSILLSWIIIPVILVAAVIYAGVILWQKIAALMEAKKPYQESYIDPVTVDLSLADNNSQLRLEILAEGEEQQDISVNLPSEVNPQPEVLAESANDGNNLEELEGSTSSIKACYPKGSKRSLGLFINGNSESSPSAPPELPAKESPLPSSRGNEGFDTPSISVG